MATTLKEGAEIVNESLRSLGYEYQIDTTDENSITLGLEAIGAYAPSQRNAIMEQMNLVIQQRNYGVMFDAAKNKFRVFLVDMMENGFGIEDVFHHLIDGREPLWNSIDKPEDIAKDLVSYEMSKISKVFHTEPFETQFKGTVDKRNYDKVFTKYGVTRFIDVTLANLSWSAEIYLQNQIIDIAKSMISKGMIKFNSGNTLNTEQGIRNTVEYIKATVNGFLTPTDEFNVGAYNEDEDGYKSVVNMSESMNDIFIITTPDYMERLKVQGYANAFNLSQFELEGRIIFAPTKTEFGKHNGEDVAFIVIDRRALVCGIKQWFASSFFVPNTKYTNHWLTIEGIKGFNTVFNAVAFTIAPIDDVELIPTCDGIDIMAFLKKETGASVPVLRRNGSIIPLKNSTAGENELYINNDFIPSGSEIEIDFTNGSYHNITLLVDDEPILDNYDSGYFSESIFVRPNSKIYMIYNG